MPQYDFDSVVPMRGTGSAKWDAFPEDVLPMWIADTDFLAPPEITEALLSRVRLGFFNYPKLSHGFREAVCHWMSRYGWQPDPEWVLFMHAVVPGLVDAIHAFSEPGEKILIQSPVYFPFHQMISRCGREKVVNSLKETERGWEIDFEDLDVRLADPAVKAMLLCSPHNPLARAFSPEELRRIGELCLKHQVVLVSDEIHCDIVFKPHRHTPTSTCSEAIAQNTVTFINPGKTFNLAGMRVAAAIIPNPALRERYAATQLARRSAEPTNLGPIALETAYTQCGWYADQLVDYLAENIRVMQRFLAEELPCLRIAEPQATYLMWLDCRGLGLSDADLYAFMLNKARIAMNAGIDFGPEGSGFMRMNIACPRTRLLEALRRIKAAVETLPARSC